MKVTMGEHYLEDYGVVGKNNFLDILYSTKTGEPIDVLELADEKEMIELAAELISTAPFDESTRLGIFVYTIDKRIMLIKGCPGCREVMQGGVDVNDAAEAEITEEEAVQTAVPVMMTSQKLHMYGILHQIDDTHYQIISQRRGTVYDSTQSDDFDLDPDALIDAYRVGDLFARVVPKITMKEGRVRRFHLGFSDELYIEATPDDEEPDKTSYWLCRTGWPVKAFLEVAPSGNPDVLPSFMRYANTWGLCMLDLLNDDEMFMLLDDNRIHIVPTGERCEYCDDRDECENAELCGHDDPPKGPHLVK